MNLCLRFSRLGCRAALGLALGLALSGCADDPVLEGARQDLRAAIPGLGPQPAFENRALPLRLPAPQAADWPQRGAGPTHAAPHAALVARPAPIWRADIGAGETRRARITAEPVVAGGRIFAMDAGATVTALDLAGARLWQADLTPPGESADEGAGGGLAWEAGRLFVSTGFGRLHALDAATGQEQWQQRFGAPVSGAVTLRDGVVHLITRDNHAYALRATDGRILWQQPGPPDAAQMLGGAGVAVDGQMAIHPVTPAGLRATFRRGGQILWEQPIAGGHRDRAYAGLRAVTGDPILSDGRVYAASSGGVVMAFGLRDGEVLWRLPRGATGRMALASGALFLVTDEPSLMRVDARSGAPVWEIPLPGYVERRAPRHKAVTAHLGPVLAGGQVILASDDGLIRLFDPADGQLRGTLDLPGGAATAPVVANGVLYVVSRQGQITAFR